MKAKRFFFFSCAMIFLLTSEMCFAQTATTYIAPGTWDISNAFSNQQSFISPKMSGTPSLPTGEYTYPLGGDIGGYGYATFIRPNPHIHNSIIIGMSTNPKIIFESITSDVRTVIDQDGFGKLSITTPLLKLVSNAGMSLILNPSDPYPVNVWKNNTDFFISPTAPNGIIHMYSAGAGYVEINGAVKLPNFTTDVTKCGSLSGSTGCFPVINSSGVVKYVPAF